MRGWMGGALLAAAMQAGAVELTVRAADVPLDPNRGFTIYSQLIGGLSLRACGAFDHERLSFKSGVAVLDLPASASCGFPQEYAVSQGDTSLTFTMGAAPSTLSARLVQPGERGPCTVTTDPQGPAAPSPGDCWIEGEAPWELRVRAGGDWRSIGGGGPGGGTIADGSVSERKLSTAALAALAGRAFDHVGDALDRGDQDATADLDFLHSDDPDTIIGRIKTGVVVLTDVAKDGDDATKLRDAASWRSALDLDQAVNEGPFDARLDVLEVTDQHLHQESVHATRARVVFTNRNIGYSLSGATQLPTEAAEGDRVTWVIQNNVPTDPDVECTNALSDLIARRRVVRDGLGLTDTNGVRCDEGDDTYHLGIDSDGDPFVGSSEGSATIPFFVTISTYRFTVDATAHLKLAPTAGTVGLSIDSAGRLEADIRPTADLPTLPTATERASADADDVMALRADKSGYDLINPRPQVSTNAEFEVQGGIWLAVPGTRGTLTPAPIGTAETGFTGFGSEHAGRLSRRWAVVMSSASPPKTPATLYINGVAFELSQSTVSSSWWRMPVTAGRGDPTAGQTYELRVTYTDGSDQLFGHTLGVSAADYTDLRLAVAKAGLYPSGCPTGQVPKGTGADAAFGCAVDATGGGGGGATNLGYTPSATQGVVTSSSGTDATIPAATATNAGLMLPAEKTKLAGVADNAEVNVLPDWNATTGDGVIQNKPTIPTLPDTATLAEARAGTEEGTRLFSPKLVADAIGALATGGDGGTAGGTTTLIDYTYPSAPSMEPNATEVPAAQWTSPGTLTAADDAKWLLVEVAITNQATGTDAKPVTDTAWFPLQRWRQDTNSALTRNIYDYPMAFYASNVRGFREYRISLGKGPNGRLALLADNSEARLKYIKVQILDGFGGGSAGSVLEPLTADPTTGDEDEIANVAVDLRARVPSGEQTNVLHCTSGTGYTGRVSPYRGCVADGITFEYDPVSGGNRPLFKATMPSIVTAATIYFRSNFGGAVTYGQMARQGATQNWQSGNDGARAEAAVGASMVVQFFSNAAFTTPLAVLPRTDRWVDWLPMIRHLKSIGLTDEDVQRALLAGKRFEIITRTAYDALSSKDPDTIYLTTGDAEQPPSYTSHTSLSSLPTSGMTVGDLHVVTQGTGVNAAVTRFVAVSATELKCVGGVTADLLNIDFGTPASGSGQDVSVPTAERWHRLPVAGQSGQFHRWDFRFPFFAVITGGINNTSGPWFNDRTWKYIDGEAVRGATAGTSGQASPAAQSVEIFTWYGNASNNWKRVRFGRQVDGSNAPWILVAIDDIGKQVYPLRIRGSCG